MNQRTIQLATLSFLLVGFIFTSTSALAYWRDVTVSKDIEIVTIGEPIEIIVTDINNGNAQLNLVPQGYAISVGDVEQVELQYEVSVSRELLNSVNLIITASDILINNVDTYSHLVDITIMGFDDEAILDLYNDTITITVQLRLIEPIDAQEAIDKGLDPSLVNVADSVLAYEEINGQTITFVLGFELQPKTEIVNND